MTKKKICWPSNQTLLLMVSIAFSLLIGVTMADDSSLPNEETFVFESVKSDENLDDFCSQESCQELRWRVETLEEAVRIIVSSLLEQKNPHFANTISRKIGKNPAVRSVLTIPPLPTAHEEEAENTQKEVNHQSQTGRASDDTILNSTDSIKDVNDFLVSSNSVNQLKFAVKCSLAHILDMNVSASSNANHSAGILNATLIHHSSASIIEKSIEIEWSPPLASCIEFVTGLWIRFYESGTEPASQSYLKIPKKCLKFKHNSSGIEVLTSNITISSNSSVAPNTAECRFSTKLINCYAYQVELIPDYQSLRGKSIRSDEIIIFPTKMPTETRLIESYLKNVTVQHDSLEFSWEDIAGCPWQLTTVVLRLWPDGKVFSKEEIENDRQKRTRSDEWYSAASTITIEPITYIIPRRYCLSSEYYNDYRYLNLKLSSDPLFSSCDVNHTVNWRPLDKCRTYRIEIESLYSSSSKTGPSFYSQIVFTSSRSSPSLTQVNSSQLQYPIDSTGSWNCSVGEILCYKDNYQSSKCLTHTYSKYYYGYEFICDGEGDCLDPKSKPINQEERIKLPSRYDYRRKYGGHATYDGSYMDEQYCNCNSSQFSGGLFRCGSQCIPNKLLCDGKYDCLNGEDESFVQCDYLNSCQHITSNSNGVFESLKPIMNSQYENATNNTRPDLIRKTTLLISADPNQVILLDFSKYSFYNSERKNRKIALYDGPYSTSPLLLNHEKYGKPSSVISTGPHLYVEYYSYQDETRGFKAYYAKKEKTDLPLLRECGGYIHPLNGEDIISITPSKHYETIVEQGYTKNSSTWTELPSNQCFWFIEASHRNGTVVMRKDYPSMNDESITIYDGWSITNSTVLYDQKTPTNLTREERDLIIRNYKTTTIFSISNKILVRFHMQTSFSWKVASIYTPNCMDQHFTESSGTINSPNYPEPYPKSVDCRWTITTVPGSAIKLLFAFFQTQEKSDFVYVYDGPTVYHPLLMEKSGTISLPFAINSSSNQLLVRFASDVGQSFNGFLAVYSLL